MIRIAAETLSPRLQYVAGFIFGRVLGVPFVLLSANEATDGNCLFYGSALPEGTPGMEASGLLIETGLPKELPSLMKVDGIPILFPAGNKSATTFGFDVFAATFFCLTRAEEYMISTRDVHGRFPASASVFYPWVQQPYVDQWIRLFGKWLVQQGLLESVHEHKTRWINTLDVDIAYAYTGRQAWRVLGSSLRDVVQLKWRRVVERAAVFAGRQPDPYDTYHLVQEAGKGANANLVFVLCAARKGPDINLDLAHPAMGALITSLQHWAEVGIHPSYAGLDNESITRTELERLFKALGHPLRSSRQHYLRFTLPATYRLLERCGIETDYSMGYADAVGFRAGTAHAFPFFDLMANEALRIEVVPLIAMDSALRHHLHLSPDAALALLQQLWQAMQLTGGNMVTVWHNHSLSDREGWEGWQKVYTSFAAGMRPTA